MLAKLDTILEKQDEQLSLLRQIAVSSSSISGEAVEELNPQMDTLERLQEFEDRLADLKFKKKMVFSAPFLILC